MRAAILTALLCVGCGFVPKPQSDSPSPEQKQRERLTLAQFKELTVGKLTREQFKEKFGKPDRTVEGSTKVVWIWDGGEFLWNADTENYYRHVSVTFNIEPDSKVISVIAS